MIAFPPADTAPPSDAALRLTLHTAATQGRIDWTQPMGDALHALGLRTLDTATGERLRWLGPLAALLDDPTVHDVCINGPQRPIWVGRDGTLAPEPLALHGEWIRWLRMLLMEQRIGGGSDAALHGVAQIGERRVRFEATTCDQTPDGPTLTLRVLPQHWPILPDLVRDGWLPPALADDLRRALASRQVTLLISGSTGSGKTTLAAALRAELGSKRVIVIEDTPELPVAAHGWNDLRFVADEVDAMLAAIRTALRQKPDYLIVGEARGAEAWAMLDGAATGHPGMTTIHAASATHAVSQLETLATSAPGVSSTLVRARLRTLPLVAIHVARRRITEVVELRRGSDPTPGGRLETTMIWATQHGQLSPTGEGWQGAWAMEDHP